MSRIYKARKAQTGTSNRTGEPFIQYSIALPSDLAVKIMEQYGEDALAFEIELTSEGVLYRPVESPDLNLEGDLPFKPVRSTGKVRKTPTAKAAKPAAKAKPKAPVAIKAKIKAGPKAKAKPGPKAPRAKATA